MTFGAAGARAAWFLRIRLAALTRTCLLLAKARQGLMKRNANTTKSVRRSVLMDPPSSCRSCVPTNASILAMGTMCDQLRLPAAATYNTKLNANTSTSAQDPAKPWQATLKRTATSQHARRPTQRKMCRLTASGRELRPHLCANGTRRRRGAGGPRGRVPCRKQPFFAFFFARRLCTMAGGEASLVRQVAQTHAPTRGCHEHVSTIVGGQTLHFAPVCSSPSSSSFLPNAARVPPAVRPTCRPRLTGTGPEEAGDGRDTPVTCKLSCRRFAPNMHRKHTP